jgi:hypothetical protein
MRSISSAACTPFALASYARCANSEFLSPQSGSERAADVVMAREKLLTRGIGEGYDFAAGIA